MAVTPTHPGVYLEEVPSGVCAITGAIPSVTACAGSAKRGPVNKAARIPSCAAYERASGGQEHRRRPESPGKRRRSGCSGSLSAGGRWAR